ncbi:hypothetical protein ACFX15_009196 [Malus domestica]
MFWECRAWAKIVKPEDEREVSMASEQTASMAGVIAAKKARRSRIDMAGNLEREEEGKGFLNLLEEWRWWWL